MDEQKQSWWKSLPGILTAATGFVAALSGLVAGLNQLGVFREHAPAPVPVVATPAPSQPAPSETTREGPAPSVTSGASSSARSAVVERRPPSPSPAPAPVPATPSPAPRGDSSSTGARLPKGAVLELAVPKRTCAPANRQPRLTARVVAPVKIGGATVVGASTTAVLHIKRGSGGPEVRLDSLVGQDIAAAVPKAQVRIVRGADGDGCLRADARLKATLGGPVLVQSR